MGQNDSDPKSASMSQVRKDWVLVIAVTLVACTLVTLMCVTIPSLLGTDSRTIDEMLLETYRDLFTTDEEQEARVRWMLNESMIEKNSPICGSVTSDRNKSGVAGHCWTNGCCKSHVSMATSKAVYNHVNQKVALVQLERYKQHLVHYYCTKHPDDLCKQCECQPTRILQGALVMGNKTRQAQFQLVWVPGCCQCVHHNKEPLP